MAPQQDTACVCLQSSKSKYTQLWTFQGSTGLYTVSLIPRLVVLGRKSLIHTVCAGSG